MYQNPDITQGMDDWIEGMDDPDHPFNQEEEEE